MTTTPAPTRPTFTKNARGHYACPAPGCQRTFIAAAGAGRHWAANHEVKPSTNGHAEEPDPFDLDHLRALADEVAQEKEAEHDDEEERDDLDGSTLYVNEDATPLPGYNPGGRVEVDHEGPVLLHPGESYLSARMLTPGEVLAHTRIDVDAVLALSDATAGLVDAITRLVAIGYDRADALQIVLDLVDKLDGRPAA